MTTKLSSCWVHCIGLGRKNFQAIMSQMHCLINLLILKANSCQSCSAISPLVHSLCSRSVIPMQLNSLSFCNDLLIVICNAAIWVGAPMNYTYTRNIAGFQSFCSKINEKEGMWEAEPGYCKHSFICTF